MTLPFDDRIFAALHDAARAAGEQALGFFRPGERTSADVATKAGGSPVTEADHAANDVLRRRLTALLPDAGWLSEETADTPDRLSRARVFIVDPIDGTRGFVAGDPRWTISVALVEEGEPVMAVLHAPALGETFAAARGRGAWLNNRLIAAGSLESGGRVAGPKPMAERLRRAGYQFELAAKIPSLAYRIALCADGRLGIGFASADSHEWDLAAADLILREAGGALWDARWRPLRYNQPDLSRGALMAGPKALLQRIAAEKVNVFG